MPAVSFSIVTNIKKNSAFSVVFDYSPLISWKEFQACMPWEIAILVGGGFALADGCEVMQFLPFLQFIRYR